MESWMKWMKANEKALVDTGGPLGKTKRVTAQGASDARNEITGYSLVQAESAEAATKLFDSNPHLQMPGARRQLVRRRQQRVVGKVKRDLRRRRER